MLVKVRVFDGLILIKKIYVLVSCMFFVFVIKILGLVLILVVCVLLGLSFICLIVKEVIIIVL